MPKLIINPRTGECYDETGAVIPCPGTGKELIGGSGGTTASDSFFVADLTQEEKINLALARLDTLELEVSKLKDTTPVPQVPSGLFKFVRPAAGTPRYGLGTQMTSPDAEEALQRAMSCVNWRGMQTRSTDEDTVWAEIEKLKTAEFSAIKPYIMLDPEFCGFALLTGLIEPACYDALSFGVNAQHREAYAGVTVQSFLDSQFAILFGGGGPSGE